MKNAETVLKLVSRLPKPRNEQVKDLLEGPLGEVYFTTPASTSTDYHACYPGGLAEHSLNVTANLKKLASALCPDRYSEGDLIFAGLLHDLGKVGDGENEYYLERDSKWHRDRGILYELNPKCSRMPVGERTIYLLQRADITLTEEEFVAFRIVEADPQEATHYRYHEPSLALLLSWSNRWSIQSEKGR